MEGGSINLCAPAFLCMCNYCVTCLCQYLEGYSVYNTIVFLLVMIDMDRDMLNWLRYSNHCIISWINTHDINLHIASGNQLFLCFFYLSCIYYCQDQNNTVLPVFQKTKIMHQASIIIIQVVKREICRISPI